MSDEFLKVARQEIQSEINSIEGILIQCKNDTHVFSRANDIENHFHKIKGLAPMMGQEKVGEIAKIGDEIMKYIIANGPLTGSYDFTLEVLEKLGAIFNGKIEYSMTDFKSRVKARFPQLLGL